jgi:DNA-binding transcriptional LysR family regulator
MAFAAPSGDNSLGAAAAPLSRETWLMTLIQLRCLIAIADAGMNITVAARRINATQPGLSKQLRQLEDELGFQVFSRRGKSLEDLTAPGAQVLSRARVMAGHVAAIRALASGHRRDIRRAAPPAGEMMAAAG